MFSMFFGAGNVVFPMLLGQYAKDKNIYAVMGLLITAIAVPFMGLIAIILYEGDYRKFFGRIGRVPGFVVEAAIIGLIGPFGALPRCIALSYSTLSLYFPALSLPLFSFLSCCLIFLLTVRQNRIVEILGYVLTPLLIGSLAIIIIMGLFLSPSAPHNSDSGLVVFLEGLRQGYQTMDLLGAFFFSSVILGYLRQDSRIKRESDYRKLTWRAFKATMIGASLLASTYIGFSYVTAFNSDALALVAKDEIPGKLAQLILGPYAGLVVCMAVSLACLTTAMALAAVSGEFLHKDIAQNKISYSASLLVTLGISFFVSTLHFTGIIKILGPILEVCYPALILLSFLNILYKLLGFRPVKMPVALLFLFTLFWRYR